MLRSMTQNSSDKLKLLVFLGSAREGRLADRVKRFVLRNLNPEKYDVTVYDPVETEFPLLKKAFHYYEDKSTAPALLVEADRKIQDADAFLLVSCEYNHSIPPALSNMMGHFPRSSFAWRPSGILTYSPSQFGGIRAAMQLRAMTGELGCISVSNIFAIPKAHDVLDENGHPNKAKDADGNEKGGHLVKGFNDLMTELDWTAKAFRNMRREHGLPGQSNL